MLFAFLFFCFFPYIRILPLELDSQPNALLLSFVIIALLGKCKLNRELAWLLFVLVAAIVCMLFSNPNGFGLRILTTYISLFFIASATYISLKYLNGIPYIFFTRVVLIWFIVGLVQCTVYPSFMDFLLLRSDNVLMLERGRGVTSLAVEPTFYGMICLFLLMINYLNFKNEVHYWLINLLLIIQLVVFSRSTTCFGVVVLSFSLYMFYKMLRSKYRICWFFLCIVLSLVIYIVAQWMVDNINIRASKALQFLLDNPSNFLTMDYSVNNRFLQAFFPIKGFIDNYGMPHGLGVFNEYLMKVDQDPFWNAFIGYDVSNDKKIVASMGATLFELGLFALPLYYVIILAWKKIAVNRPSAPFWAFLLFALMLNHMNFNQAILPMFIGNLIFICHKRLNCE